MKRIILFKFIKITIPKISIPKLKIFNIWFILLLLTSSFIYYVHTEAGDYRTDKSHKCYLKYKRQTTSRSSSSSTTYDMFYLKDERNRDFELSVTYPTYRSVEEGSTVYFTISESQIEKNNRLENLLGFQVLAFMLGVISFIGYPCSLLNRYTNVFD